MAGLLRLRSISLIVLPLEKMSDYARCQYILSEVVRGVRVTRTPDQGEAEPINVATLPITKMALNS